MFNDSFYPSPAGVRALLHANIRTKKRHTKYEQDMLILEPSAGKGDLLKDLRCKIHTIEKDPSLREFLIGAGHMLIHDDFLTYDTQYEYDAIIMNPPFDEGAKHVLKAIELAEKQNVKPCAIRAVINAETIENPFSNERKELIQKLERFGATVTYHTEMFTKAERKTNVRIALIQCDIYPESKGGNAYDRIVNDLHDETVTNDAMKNALSTIVTPNEVAERLHDIAHAIKLYEAHIEQLKTHYKAKESLHYFEELSDYEQHYIPKSQHTLESETERIRRHYWARILDTKTFSEHMTNAGREKLQNTLNEVGRIEITTTNVQNLLQSLIQNKDRLLLDVCVDMFKNMTRYVMNEYSKNIHYYNGWKTNNAYRLNKKIIVPNQIRFLGIMGIKMATEYDELDYEIKNYMDDLMTCLQLIDPTIDPTFKARNAGEFENDVLRFKLFKKGTIHIWFKNLELLNRFNFIVGQEFNWLPTDDEIKTSKKAQDFIRKEFKPYTKQLA